MTGLGVDETAAARPAEADLAAQPGSLAPAVAAYGLTTPSVLRAEPLEAAAWDNLVQSCLSGRVLPMLVQAIADGALAADDEQRAELTELDQGLMSSVLMLEQLMVQATDTLRAAGIDHRVMKGSALAHTAYPDPSHRVFGDLDLLVRGADIEAAIVALGTLGIQRSRVELRRGFDRRFAKAVTMYTPDKRMVDLHRTLATGRFGLTIDEEDLFAAPEEFQVGGRRLPTFDPTVRFIAACYNAALGDKSSLLRSLRDVAQTALSSALDTDHALAVAERWQGRAVVARAVSAAWHRLDLPPTELSGWAKTYERAPWEEKAFRALGENAGSEMLASISAIRGLRAKLAYACAIVLPRRKAVKRLKRRGYLQWFARGVKRLRARRA